MHFLDHKPEKEKNAIEKYLKTPSFSMRARTVDTAPLRVKDPRIYPYPKIPNKYDGNQKPEEFLDYFKKAQKLETQWLSQTRPEMIIHLKHRIQERALPKLSEMQIDRENKQKFIKGKHFWNLEKIKI